MVLCVGFEPTNPLWERVLSPSPFPLGKHSMVGVAGFEPATCSLQENRPNHWTIRLWSTQRESNSHKSLTRGLFQPLNYRCLLINSILLVIYKFFFRNVRQYSSIYNRITRKTFIGFIVNKGPYSIIIPAHEPTQNTKYKKGLYEQYYFLQLKDAL